jgi:CO/xanthine dehydrogenase FAD-binding subunit
MSGPEVLGAPYQQLVEGYDFPFARPATWIEALEQKAAHPDRTPLLGGTDLLVELNFRRRRPSGLIDLSAIDEITSWHRDGDWIELGAGVTYRRIERELAGDVDSLAIAARTVGSPQIRNRGTVAGNLGTASPAGDAHPPLLALGATVVAESLAGRRLIPIDEFFVGPKRNSLRADELIRSVRFPAAAGAQQFSKVGTRNAMVIATTSFALVVHEVERRFGTGIGSAGPTPLRATDAERFAAEQLADRWDDPEAVDRDTTARFGELVAAAARPIDDVRGTASYRLHSLSVIAARCLSWCWAERFEGADR